MSYNRGKLAISARVIFVNEDGKVLLGLREKAAYASGKWMLPGGTTDRHETVLESAIRESKEELGILVKKENLNFVGMVHWYKAEKDTDGSTFNWACYHWDYIHPDMTEPQNQEADKCRRIDWFDSSEIDDLNQNGLMESTSYDLLKEFLQGKKSIYVESDWPESFED